MKAGKEATPAPVAAFRTLAGEEALTERLRLERSISPRLLADPGAELDFREEAEWYLENGAHPDDTAEAADWASRFRWNLETRLIVAVPVHAAERSVIPLLDALATPDNPNLQVLLLLNAPLSMSLQEYEKNVQRHRDQVEDFARRRRAAAPVVLEKRMDEPLLGRVRALLMLTAVHAALQAGIADPILVSQDADLLGASTGLIPTITGAFNNPLLDAAAGPILYSGCDPSGRPLYGDRLLPELYVGGKYLSAADDATLSGRMAGLPDVFTPGANSAFRLASMCAAGGYNRAFGGTEDIDMGQRIKAMRRYPGDGRFFHEERVAFLRQTWISTSPRRGLAAILQGAALNEQWQSFFGLVSAELDDHMLASQYEQQSNLLQVRDVHAGASGDAVARTKTHARIRNIFRRSLRQDGITDDEVVRALARGMGLCVTRVTMREGSAPRIHVDWKRSAFPEELQAWVARWSAAPRH